MSGGSASTSRGCSPSRVSRDWYEGRRASYIVGTVDSEDIRRELTKIKRGLLVLALALLAMPGPGVTAQSVEARTPNLQGPWTAPRGVIQFNFLPRFSISDAPLRKVTNTPSSTSARG